MAEQSGLRREIFAEGFLGFGVLVAFAQVEGVGAIANHVRAETDNIAVAVTYPLFGVSEQVFADRLRAESFVDDEAADFSAGMDFEAAEDEDGDPAGDFAVRHFGYERGVLVGIGHRREAVRNFLRSGGIGKLAGQVGEARVVFFARGADRSGEVFAR